MNYLKTISKSVIHFIAPKICLVCSSNLSELKDSQFICRNCIDNVPLAPPGDILLGRIESHYENSDNFYLSSIYSYFTYTEGDNYSSLIHDLKYNGLWSIGVELGREFGKLLNLMPNFNYDALLPVPIHHARRRERGYNQAEMIARGLNEITGIPVDTILLTRSRYTTTQTKLGKEARRKNVSRVFRVPNESEAKGKTFLIIDDVLTTGSTLNACAEALLEAGARRVDAATLAVAGQ